MGISFLIAIVIAIGYFFYLSKKQDNDIKDKQITEEAFKYEKHGIGSILIVKKKSSIAASNLTVLAHREIFTKEIPDRIVYTGATVGGITTGGFHIQKGGIAYSEGAKTGQYSLCYRYAGVVNNEPWSEVVSFLQLSDELMKEANENPTLKRLIVTEEQQKQLDDLYRFNGRRNLISLLDLNEGTAQSIKAWLGSNNAINCALCGKALNLNRFAIGKSSTGKMLWKCPDCARKGGYLKIVGEKAFFCDKDGNVLDKP